MAATLPESKSVATNRLRREGRWEEASAYKDEVIAELRGQGMKRGDAGTEAWRRMIDKYPALSEEVVAATKTTSDDPPEVAEMLAAMDNTAPDVVRDTLWAYEHLENQAAKPDTAPSRGAWSLLKWAREYRSRFFESFLPKAMAAKAKQPDEEKDLEHDQRHIDQIRSTLAQFVEEAKPRDLEDAVANLVDEWATGHRRRLKAEERENLEGSVCELVGRYQA